MVQPQVVMAEAGHTEKGKSASGIVILSPSLEAPSGVI